MKSLLRSMRDRRAATQPGHMTLMSHLGELRNRLIICVLVVTVFGTVAFFFWDQILDIAVEPYCDAQHQRDVASSCQLVIPSLPQLLTTRMSVSMYLGIFFASPVILWHLWRFITPGLNPNEKRYAIPFVGCSVLLFVAGAAVAWLTFPQAIKFMIDIGGSNVQTLLNPGPYLKLIFLMMAVFGLVFEIPVILVFLQLARVVKSTQLKRFRRYAIVINFAGAAILTPSGDPYSLLAMALPMCAFYEIAIIIGRVLKR